MNGYKPRLMLISATIKHFSQISPSVVSEVPVDQEDIIQLITITLLTKLNWDLLSAQTSGAPIPHKKKLFLQRVRHWL